MELRSDQRSNLGFINGNGATDMEKAMHNSLVNSQKGSGRRVCISTYFNAADSKSDNRFALSGSVFYLWITDVKDGATYFGLEVQVSMKGPRIQKRRKVTPSKNQ